MAPDKRSRRSWYSKSNERLTISCCNKERRFDGRVLSTGFPFGCLPSSGRSRCNKGRARRLALTCHQGRTSNL